MRRRSQLLSPSARLWSWERTRCWRWSLGGAELKGPDFWTHWLNLAQVAGAIASSSVGAQWRAGLAFAASLPFFAGIACARGLIESPRWLLATNKHVQLRTQTRQEAARTFNGTGTPGANRVTSILDDTLRNSGDSSEPVRKSSFRRPTPSTRRSSGTACARWREGRRRSLAQ